MHPGKLPYFRGVALGHVALACSRSDVRCDCRFRCIDVPPLQPAAPLRAFSLPARLSVPDPLRATSNATARISSSRQNHRVLLHPGKLPYFRGVALGHEALAYPCSDVRCDCRFRCIDVPPFRPAAFICGLFLCPPTNVVPIRSQPPDTRFSPHAKITGFTVT